jgi:hypothetical protein
VRAHHLRWRPGPARIIDVEWGNRVDTFTSRNSGASSLRCNMATVPRKARRLSAEFRRSSDAVPHHASDAAASTGMKLERAATPPTPANVTWLRDHFQKARIRREREAARSGTPLLRSTLTSPSALHDTVFTKVPIATPRSPSPEQGYIGQLERTRSLQFLLSPPSGQGLRTAQQSLALCHLLLERNDRHPGQDRRAVTKERLRECLQLVVNFARR